MLRNFQLFNPQFDFTVQRILIFRESAVFFPTNFVPKTCHDIFPGDCSKFTNSLYNSTPLTAPEKPFSKLLAPEYVLDLS